MSLAQICNCPDEIRNHNHLEPKKLSNFVNHLSLSSDFLSFPPQNCTGHGTCINQSFCQCDPGWKGDQCESPTTCPGIPSGADGTECCFSGVVGARAQCCQSASAVLDAAGECCESGHVDACGACDGRATSVDALGRCCETVRDEKGICCAR